MSFDIHQPCALVMSLNFPFKMLIQRFHYPFHCYYLHIFCYGCRFDRCVSVVCFLCFSFSFLKYYLNYRLVCIAGFSSRSRSCATDIVPGVSGDAGDASCIIVNIIGVVVIAVSTDNSPTRCIHPETEQIPFRCSRSDIRR